MKPTQQKLARRLKENPDQEYMGQDEDLYFCKSCFSQSLKIAKTGFIYCDGCSKMLDHLDNIIQTVERI